jgi:hypothetical protein
METTAAKITQLRTFGMCASIENGAKDPLVHALLGVGYISMGAEHAFTLSPHRS